MRAVRSRRRFAITGWLAISLAAAASAAVLWTAWSGALRPAAGRAWPFPCLGAEGLALHVHPLVRIVVNEHPVRLPAGIGIEDPVYVRGIAVSGRCFEPIHTHDASGIVHIESPTVRSYTLADFFRVWQATYPTVQVGGAARPVAWTARAFLGMPLGSGHELRVVVDGHASSAGPALDLTRLDYCDAATASTPPCWPTARGGPWPLLWAQRYGTQHTIVLDYGTTGTAGVHAPAP